MLENFAYLVDTLGHIPNGNRIYYERRSQPPLFISMVDAYYRVTEDDIFLRKHINAMDKEFRFWMDNRMENKTEGGRVYKVAVYNVEVDGPRPESYREDYRDAQSFETPAQQTDFYMNMKSGAESGWDYSTKWFVGPNGEPSQELTDVKTRRVVPVELNSYLCKNAKLMREYYEKLGNAAKEAEYEQYANDIRVLINLIRKGSID